MKAVKSVEYAGFAVLGIALVATVGCTAVHDAGPLWFRLAWLANGVVIAWFAVRSGWAVYAGSEPARTREAQANDHAVLLAVPVSSLTIGQYFTGDWLLRDATVGVPALINLIWLFALYLPFHLRSYLRSRGLGAARGFLRYYWRLLSTVFLEFPFTVFALLGYVSALVVDLRLRGPSDGQPRAHASAVTANVFLLTILTGYLLLQFIPRFTRKLTETAAAATRRVLTDKLLRAKPRLLILGYGNLGQRCLRDLLEFDESSVVGNMGPSRGPGGTQGRVRTHRTVLPGVAEIGAEVSRSRSALRSDDPRRDVFDLRMDVLEDVIVADRETTQFLSVVDFRDGVRVGVALVEYLYRPEATRPAARRQALALAVIGDITREAVLRATKASTARLTIDTTADFAVTQAVVHTSRLENPLQSLEPQSRSLILTQTRSSDANALLPHAQETVSCVLYPVEARAGALALRAISLAERHLGDRSERPRFLVIGRHESLYRICEMLDLWCRRGQWPSGVVNSTVPATGTSGTTVVETLQRAATQSADPGRERATSFTIVALTDDPQALRVEPADERGTGSQGIGSAEPTSQRGDTGPSGADVASAATRESRTARVVRLAPRGARTLHLATPDGAESPDESASPDESVVQVIQAKSLVLRNVRTALELDGVLPTVIIVSFPDDTAGLHGLLNDLSIALEQIASEVDAPGKPPMRLPAIVVGCSELVGPVIPEGAQSGQEVRYHVAPPDEANALFYHDHVVADRRYMSFPRGLVDAQADSLDIVRGVWAAASGSASRRGPHAEFTFCIVDRPGSYAAVLAQVAGLERIDSGARTQTDTDARLSADNVPRACPGSTIVDLAGLRLLSLARPISVLRARAALAPRPKTMPTFAQSVRSILCYRDESEISKRRVDSIFAGLPLTSVDRFEYPIGGESQTGIVAHTRREADCGCPEMRTCPITVSKRWVHAGLAGGRHRSAQLARERLLLNTALDVKDLASLESPRAATSICSADIEVYLHSSSSAGSVAIALNHLCLQRVRRRNTSADANQIPAVLNVSYIMTDPCESRRYGFDRLYGALEEGSASQDLKERATTLAIVVWPTGDDRPWRQYCAEVRDFLNAVLESDGSAQESQFRLAILRPRVEGPEVEVSSATAPGWPPSLLVVARVQPRGRSDGSAESTRSNGSDASPHAEWLSEEQFEDPRLLAAYLDAQAGHRIGGLTGVLRRFQHDTGSSDASMRGPGGSKSPRESHP
jgi:voltage-gated potassium channel Kch